MMVREKVENRGEAKEALVSVLMAMAQKPMAMVLMVLEEAQTVETASIANLR